MIMEVPKRNEDAKDIGDITINLPSLQFESALSDEEKDLLILRKRSHAITVAACTQATYFVSVLNEARQIHAQLRNPEQRQAARLLGDGMSKNPLKVGIIGCGRLGSHLANFLLSFGESNPDDIKISTRRPETLTELQDKGVSCVQDNVQVASSSHLLFLCVLPSQFSIVAEEIKHALAADCLIYSFMSSLSASRLKQLLHYSNIISPEFQWETEHHESDWDITTDPAESVVTTDEKFAEEMVYAFINLCTHLGLNRKETLDTLNAVVLGHSSKHPIKNLFRMEDITRVYAEKTALFPLFDLSVVVVRETPITQRLVHHEVVRQAFVDRYCNIFHQYLAWKKQQAGKW